MAMASNPPSLEFDKARLDELMLVVPLINKEKPFLIAKESVPPDEETLQIPLSMLLELQKELKPRIPPSNIISLDYLRTQHISMLRKMRIQSMGKHGNGIWFTENVYADEFVVYAGIYQRLDSIQKGNGYVASCFSSESLPICINARHAHNKARLIQNLADKKRIQDARALWETIRESKGVSTDSRKRAEVLLREQIAENNLLLVSYFFSLQINKQTVYIPVSVLVARENIPKNSPAGYEYSERQDYFWNLKCSRALFSVTGQCLMNYVDFVFYTENRKLMMISYIPDFSLAELLEYGTSTIGDNYYILPQEERKRLKLHYEVGDLDGCEGFEPAAIFKIDLAQCFTPDGRFQVGQDATGNRFLISGIDSSIRDNVQSHLAALRSYDSSALNDELITVRNENLLCINLRSLGSLSANALRKLNVFLTEVFSDDSPFKELTSMSKAPYKTWCQLFSAKPPETAVPIYVRKPAPNLSDPRLGTR